MYVLHGSCQPQHCHALDKGAKRRRLLAQSLGRWGPVLVQDTRGKQLLLALYWRLDVLAAVLVPPDRLVHGAELLR